jgi:hypothetical protein
VLGCSAAIAKASDAGGIVALRHALSAFITHEIAVVVGGNRKPKSSKYEYLACRRFEQINSPNNFCDLHLGIVNDYRQLICRDVIPPPNDEVSKILFGDESLGSQVDVIEDNCLSIRNSESPIHADWSIKVLCIGSRSAASRIDRLIVDVIRSSGRER